MPARDRSHALDHVVLVLFDNCSLDKRAWAPSTAPRTARTSTGVIGKNFRNPIPEWAEHGLERKAVPYAVATDMDARTRLGRGYPHTNTQLFNILDEETGSSSARTGQPALERTRTPGRTHDGWVRDRLHQYVHRGDRAPAHLRGVRADHDRVHPRTDPGPEHAREAFGAFDHWFCQVPSKTLLNRSFWTAATSSGFVINEPATNFTQQNTAETLFDPLEAHGRTWKVYAGEPMQISFTGLTHSAAEGPPGDELRPVR